jgi:hypothetical protein
MKASVFWHITPCSPLKAKGYFWGTYLLHLQGWRESRNQHEAGTTQGYENFKSNIIILYSENHLRSPYNYLASKLFLILKRHWTKEMKKQRDKGKRRSRRLNYIHKKTIRQLFCITLAQYSDYITGWTTEESWFNSWQGQKFCLFTASALAIQTLFQWVPGYLTAGIATTYGLDDQEVEVRVSVRARIFTSPCHPDRLWSPPSLSNRYRG